MKFVPLDKLVSKINVRRDLEDIDRLTDSLREDDLLESLLVSETNDGMFEIICGMRSYIVAKKVWLSGLLCPRYRRSLRCSVCGTSRIRYRRYRYVIQEACAR